MSKCICDEVTKALGGALINCPAHGSSFVLGMVSKIENLQAQLAAKDAEIEGLREGLRRLEWVYDERVGMVAVYQGKERGCLDTDRDDFVFARYFKNKSDGAGWIKDEAVCECAQRLVESHNAELAALLPEEPKDAQPQPEEDKPNAT